MGRRDGVGSGRAEISEHTSRSGAAPSPFFMSITSHLPTLLLVALIAPTTASGVEPANPKASEDARKVLSFLHDLPNRTENRVISGHFVGGSIGPNNKTDKGYYKFSLKEVEELHKLTGQWVGLIGADYCVGFNTSPNPIEDLMYYKDMNRQMIEYWKAGGLIAITTHQFDPRELHRQGGRCFPHQLPKGVERLDVSRVYTPGTEEYANFRVIMDRWCEGFQELKDAGVVVLWRPLNEARDGKWWCAVPAKQYKALYRYIFDYMTRTKGLDNLLWVYDSSGGGGKPPKQFVARDEADQPTGEAPAKQKTRAEETSRPKGKDGTRLPREVHVDPREMDLYYYPGDDVVDIIGYTMNWDSGANKDKVRPLPHKVFACIEFNVRTAPEDMQSVGKPRNYDYTKKFNWVKANLPYASYFMSWWRIWGPANRGTPESVRAMFNDPIVANRGELDWRRMPDSTASKKAGAASSGPASAILGPRKEDES